MRILVVHNYYQRRGGEDESTDQEVHLLRKYGHQVKLYSRHNDEIKSFSLPRKALLFLEPTWSSRSYQEIKRVIQEFRPDIVHFQNFFPLISPAAYYACAESRVPVVQTLRNYRLLCPSGLFFRDGKVCEECMGHSLWRSLFYGCYRNSRIQTAPVVLMLLTHRMLRTWLRKVDAYIALTEFSKQRFVEGGLPEDKIFVRPNFLSEDPGPGELKREFGVFVGRLSPEKGLKVLLEAWRGLPDVPLKIVGDGPLRPWIEEYIRQNGLDKVELVGFVSSDVVLEYLKRALFLVVPSVWYETFGRTIIEAYATGTPVVASRLGAMVDLVEEGRTGLLFNPGNSEDLKAKIWYIIEHPDEARCWGQKARHVFEEKYSSHSAYVSLIEIYRKALKNS